MRVAQRQAAAAAVAPAQQRIAADSAVVDQAPSAPCWLPKPGLRDGGGRGPTTRSGTDRCRRTPRAQNSSGTRRRAGPPGERARWSPAPPAGPRRAGSTPVRTAPPTRVAAGSCPQPARHRGRPGPACSRSPLVRCAVSGGRGPFPGVAVPVTAARPAGRGQCRVGSELPSPRRQRRGPVMAPGHRAWRSS